VIFILGLLSACKTLGGPRFVGGEHARARKLLDLKCLDYDSEYVGLMFLSFVFNIIFVFCFVFSHASSCILYPVLLVRRTGTYHYLFVSF
jgi:hypothetical protein